MDLYSGHINKLIEELAALPGIGSKSAQRLAFHLIGMPKEKVKRLTDVIVEARENVRYCRECFTLTDREVCPVCANEKRNHGLIMVVENTRDLAAYEKTGRYEGVYHVLHGAISPMLGIGPGEIRLKELMERLRGGGGGGHHRHQLQLRGRDHGHVYRQAHQAYGHQSDPHRQRRTGGR